MIRKTKNIRLATCWKAFGATYEGVDRTDLKHQEFKFSTPNDTVSISKKDEVYDVHLAVDMDEIERQLVNGNLMVNAKDLFDAFQDMKSIIHSR